MSAAEDGGVTDLSSMMAEDDGVSVGDLWGPSLVSTPLREVRYIFPRESLLGSRI